MRMGESWGRDGTYGCKRAWKNNGTNEERNMQERAIVKRKCSHNGSYSFHGGGLLSSLLETEKKPQD